MGQPVLFLWMARATDSWNELSEEEQNAMMAKVGESLDRVGGKNIVMASCEWSTPDFQFCGVEEFPSIAALQKHINDQREMGYLDHGESTYVVGTPWEDDD